MILFLQSQMNIILLIFFILMGFEIIIGKWITAVTAKMQFGQRSCVAFICNQSWQSQKHKDLMFAG